MKFERLRAWLAALIAPAPAAPASDETAAADPLRPDEEAALRGLIASQGKRGREVEALVDGLRKLDPKTRAQVIAVTQGRRNQRKQIERRWEAETNHWYQNHPEERPS